MSCRLRCAALRVAPIFVAASTTVAHAQTTALPSFSIRTPAYEIYSPDSTLLPTARAEIEFAIAEFARYFGRAPAPLAVVYIDETDASLKADAFLARGFRALPMVTPRAISGLLKTNSAPQKAGAESEGRILSHEACHQFFIDYVDKTRDTTATKRVSSSRGYGHPDIPDWLDEAVATLCEGPTLSSQRLGSLQSRIAQRIPLSELFSMTHPRSTTLPTEAPSAPAGKPVDLSRAKFYSLDGKESQPDSATLDMIKRALAGEQGTGMRLERIDSITPRASLPRETLRTVVSRMDAATEDRMSVFYGEVQTLARFLASKAGDRFIGRLTDALVAGQAIEKALQSAPQLPRSLTDLERDWVAYVGGPKLGLP